MNYSKDGKSFAQIAAQTKDRVTIKLVRNITMKKQLDKLIGKWTDSGRTATITITRDKDYNLYFSQTTHQYAQSCFSSEYTRFLQNSRYMYVADNGVGVVQFNVPGFCGHYSSSNIIKITTKDGRNGVYYSLNTASTGSVTEISEQIVKR